MNAFAQNSTIVLLQPEWADGRASPCEDDDHSRSLFRGSVTAQLFFRRLESFPLRGFNVDEDGKNGGRG